MIKYYIGTYVIDLEKNVGILNSSFKVFMVFMVSWYLKDILLSLGLHEFCEYNIAYIHNFYII